MKQDFFKRLLFASLFGLCCLIVFFGLARRHETGIPANTGIQVVVFTVAVVLLESALYAWRKQVTGDTPNRYSDGIYAVLLLAVTAVAYFLARLVGRWLSHFIP